MSFNKAQLKRFNEETSCAPPPGRYDPKLDTKIKGAVVLNSTSKRFPDQSCCSSSLDNLNHSSSSQVTFRTPQVMRKITLTPRVKYLHEKKMDTPGSDSSLNSTNSDDRPIAIRLRKNITRPDYQRLEQELGVLTDKHLQELTKKNNEIKKLKEDLITSQNHEAELKEILEEKSKLLLERNSDMLELKNNLDSFEEKFASERREKQIYTCELEEKISQLETLKEDLEGVIKEKKFAFTLINDKCLSLENKIENLHEEKDNLSVILSDIITSSTKRFEEHEKDYKLKLHHFEEVFQNKTNSVSSQFEKKFSEIENQTKKSFETIAEVKNLFTQELKEFLNNVKEADDRCKLVYRELCKAEQERDDLLISDLEKKLSIIDIQEKCDLLKKNFDECRGRCKKYELTLNTMQETIRALSTRLMESESEVERLNGVEKDLETQKLALEEKSQLLYSNICALKNSMEKLESSVINDVIEMKTDLEAKVDYFKEEAVKQIDIFTSKLNEKQHSLDRLIDENEQLKKDLQSQEKNYEGEVINMRITNDELSTMLKTAKERIKTEIPTLQQENTNKDKNIVELLINIDSLKDSIVDHEAKISCLVAEKNSLALLLSEAKDEISALKNDRKTMSNTIAILKEKISVINSKYESGVREIESLLNSIQSQNETMKFHIDSSIEARGKVEELQEIILQLESDGPIAENNKLRSDIDELNHKLRLVTEEKNRLDEEVAELMGHQNIHQKIKHVNQLKQHNLELKKVVDSLEIENTRLKKKLAESKENTIPHRENTPRPLKVKNKNLSVSPAVLRERNH